MRDYFAMPRHYYCRRFSSLFSPLYFHTPPADTRHYAISPCHSLSRYASAAAAIFDDIAAAFIFYFIVSAAIRFSLPLSPPLPPFRAY
jgi:hypothetical protein